MKGQIDALGKACLTVEDYVEGRPYDEITIVNDPELGISAISRIPVPAGVPITDERFWLIFNKLDIKVFLEYRELKNKMHNLEVEMASFLRSTQPGTALSNEFGDSEIMGVTQKALTDAMNRIWNKFEEITGESYNGISMIVSPEYYIGEDGSNVHVSGTAVDTTGIFEHIAIYFNSVLIKEYNNVASFSFDERINETTIVTCEAKILGITYTKHKIVTHYSSFFLGAGSSYEQIMNVSHVVSINNEMRGSYNVEVQNGQHIIIVVGESLNAGFTRADMNGVEIRFIESTATVEGKTYKVYTSENVYSAGTYNIDINS